MARGHSLDRRHHIVSARLTSAQFIRLAERAHRSGSSLSAAILELIEERIDGPCASSADSPAVPWGTVDFKPVVHDRLAALGARLNAVAHDVNSHNRPPPLGFDRLLIEIEQCIGPIIASVVPSDRFRPVLAPRAYHAVNRQAVNLRQIRDRLRYLHISSLPPVDTLWMQMTRWLDACDGSSRHDRQNQ